MPSNSNSHDVESRAANQLQNNYHRPNFPWVCGNAAIGEPCWTGPKTDGSCGCRAECYPIARGGGWACSRPLHRGGPCTEGPTEDGKCCRERPPCVPQRSLRSQRHRLSFALLCMTVGIGLIVYGSGRTYDFIAPGPLSSPHAERLAHQGNDRCSSCHPQAHQSLGQWMSKLVGSSINAKSVTQTDLCLNCHQRDMCSEFPAFAHNVSPSVLSEISQSSTDCEQTGSNLLAVQQASGRVFFGSKFQNGQEIACATCHREHHGQQIDMKAMTDQQCQSCHGQNFHSFEHDHPEFKSWPQIVGQGIRFDHGSHHFKHFPQSSQPFECTQCHRDDRQGNVQQLVGFDQACGACHQGPIDLKFEGGLALLQLPSLNVAELQSFQQDVGSWPENLSHSFDGRLSALSEILLRADRDAAAGLTVLGPGFDFLDLEPSDPAQAKAAAQVAWGIKRLLADLALRGHEAIRQRLQLVFETPIDDSRLARLSQNFSPTMVQDSARLWFPELWNEVTAEQVSPISAFGRQPPTNATSAHNASSRLVLPNDLLARILQPARVVQDQPQELLLENPLAGAYGQTKPAPQNNSNPTTIAATTPNAVTPPNAVIPPNAVTKPTIAAPPVATAAPATGTASSVGASPAPVKPVPAKAGANDQTTSVALDVSQQATALPTPAANVTVAPQQPAIDDPNLLARNPLANYGGENRQPAPSTSPPSSRPPIEFPPAAPPVGSVPPTDGDLVVASPTVPSPTVPSPAVPESSSAAVNPTITTKPVPASAEPAVDADSITPASKAPGRAGQGKFVGWVRDDANYSLEYHLQGHSDLWLKEWIDLLHERQSSGESADWLTHAVGVIVTPDQSGSCLQCHGNTTESNPLLAVNWTAQYRDPTLKGWTKFNHRPHTLLPGLSDCRSCHQLLEPQAASGTVAALANRSQGPTNIQTIGFSRQANSSADTPELENSPGPTPAPRSVETIELGHRSDFHSLTKSQCASCHREGSTRNSCTTCHNYHIGQRVQQ